MAPELRAASAIEGASSTKPVATARKAPAPSRAAATARVAAAGRGSEGEPWAARSRVVDAGIEAVRAGAVPGGAQAEADGWPGRGRTGRGPGSRAPRRGEALGDAGADEPAVGHEMRIDRHRRRAEGGEGRVERAGRGQGGAAHLPSGQEAATARQAPPSPPRDRRARGLAVGEKQRPRAGCARVREAINGRETVPLADLNRLTCRDWPRSVAGAIGEGDLVPDVVLARRLAHRQALHLREASARRRRRARRRPPRC